MEKVRLMEAMNDEERKTIHTMLDAFVGKITEGCPFERPSRCAIATKNYFAGYPTSFPKPIITILLFVLFTYSAWLQSLSFSINVHISPDKVDLKTSIISLDMYFELLSNRRITFSFL